MLRPIKLNNQSGAMAIKIDYKIINYTLFIYFYRIMLQKVIPQMLLPMCHIPPQAFCNVK